MKFSYYTNDCTVLSWDSALIIEPSGEPEIADILEFAHAQLLTAGSLVGFRLKRAERALHVEGT